MGVAKESEIERFFLRGNRVSTHHSAASLDSMCLEGSPTIPFGCRITAKVALKLGCCLVSSSRPTVGTQRDDGSDGLGCICVQRCAGCGAAKHNNAARV